VIKKTIGLKYGLIVLSSKTTKIYLIAAH